MNRLHELKAHQSCNQESSSSQARSRVGSSDNRFAWCWHWTITIDKVPPKTLVAVFKIGNVFTTTLFCCVQFAVHDSVRITVASTVHKVKLFLFVFYFHRVL